MKARTSLALDDVMWRKFRAACVERGVTASSIIEHAIAEQLKTWGVTVEEEPPKKRRTRRSKHT